ncbi:MAG: PRC-barrel domain-containing protein [Bdellovibrionales bacterium]|nr:PRC-barrel domain-containing protein [Bdellovibrionales bacterium]
MSEILLGASSILADHVFNKEGDKLGQVIELMIDPSTASIIYAVMSFGGFMGFGKKLFALPIQRFSIDKSRESLILDISKEELKDAPGFDKNDWPREPQPEFIKKVYGHYKVKPS